MEGRRRGDRAQGRADTRLRCLGSLVRQCPPNSTPPPLDLKVPFRGHTDRRPTTNGSTKSPSHHHHHRHHLQYHLDPRTIHEYTR